MVFEFATATRIVFGPGRARELPQLAAELGRRALLVTGRRRRSTAEMIRSLEAAGLVGATLTVTGEPTDEQARDGAQHARGAGCDLVVSVGGGSVIDAGKAIAALLANPGDPLDYLEVVGAGRPLTQPSRPFVAVPTTAGSGAEVTRNAVLACRSRGVKASLRSAFMLPRLAIVDPLLTLDLPPAVTAATGMDALAQLVEPYLSRRANPFTDALCREGMVLVSHWLRRAWEDGADAAAREGMALASLFGGLALANAGLGAVHGLAGPLGGRFPAPHGAVCAALLPAVLAVNLAALRERDPAGEAVQRFAHVARLLTGDRDAAAEDGVRWIETLRADLQVPLLGAWGVTAADLAAVADQACASSSMRGNPIDLGADQLQDILRRSL